MELYEQNSTTAADPALRQGFDKARIEAAANETHMDDLRYEAETLAEYIIMKLPKSSATEKFQNNVRSLLALSRLTNEELDADSRCRETITYALDKATKVFMDEHTNQQRAALNRSADLTL